MGTSQAFALLESGLLARGDFGSSRGGTEGHGNDLGEREATGRLRALGEEGGDCSAALTRAATPALRAACLSGLDGAAGPEHITMVGKCVSHAKSSLKAQKPHYTLP